MKETAERVKTTLASLPPHVLLVAACKTRTASEVREAMSEWESQRTVQTRWHLIGHLQRNKAKRAVELFDMIETVDSVRIARAVGRHCAAAGKTMPVLIEINSGRESSKTGVPPDEVADLAQEIVGLQNIRLQGLMTMGPRFGDPEDARPYFRLARELFNELSSANTENVEMRYLSMGMSNSYEVAIEEGANIIRIGTKLFGARKDS